MTIKYMYIPLHSKQLPLGKYVSPRSSQSMPVSHQPIFTTSFSIPYTFVEGTYVFSRLLSTDISSNVSRSFRPTFQAMLVKFQHFLVFLVAHTAHFSERLHFLIARSVFILVVRNAQETIVCVWRRMCTTRAVYILWTARFLFLCSNMSNASAVTLIIG